METVEQTAGLPRPVVALCGVAPPETEPERLCFERRLQMAEPGPRPSLPEGCTEIGPSAVLSRHLDGTDDPGYYLLRFWEDRV
ncbi:MAG: hypothetical protein AVDCRST_MAG02-110 [uncultured Rubrobacteraceae bacterium]|uniref:Uncharacterized protein n=1 Tax=uncultured Rubrobacteraceae bacterium TaxID=349277 RepID=A0A6J4QIE8_9ACTN|nr:MAG: hypothetical protein AVDCRST_MAG02-110 [uncultured Rubrobacteraceae bacterium]